MKYYVITIIAAICITISCSKPKAHKFSYPMPETKEDCMQLFEDIMSVQSKREEGFIQIENDLRSLEAGGMSVRKFRKKRLEWLSYEKDLRIKVTHMYDIGYKYGCFVDNG